MLWTFGEGRSNAGVNGTVLHGRESLNLPRSSYLQSVSFILGRANASPSNTQGGSPVRESCTPGSVRGVLSNGHSYRDSLTKIPGARNRHTAADLPVLGGGRLFGVPILH
jgi:hypothetical protein